MMIRTVSGRYGNPVGAKRRSIVMQLPNPKGMTILSGPPNGRQCTRCPTRMRNVCTCKSAVAGDSDRAEDPLDVEPYSGWAEEIKLVLQLEVVYSDDARSMYPWYGPDTARGNNQSTPQI
ncbi:hypothetical protein PCH_Pc20g05170 [Penicillium rubens Wisconsin 54-1255]|uniref:Uncharacterized protein n=1 Tax=Penicillium rubens (strain ATCC 28089 / DSM 1075 / NRRL 1951 / Wisconsin 54-1255) TaxID=500485 RepID=B6HEF7_PENRW|nr:hypothetical protein PCH_Pc20g05170 [Penicillium rubens Wisconsin 54-1255]